MSGDAKGPVESLMFTAVSPQLKIDQGILGLFSAHNALEAGPACVKVAAGLEECCRTFSTVGKISTRSVHREGTFKPEVFAKLKVPQVYMWMALHPFKKQPALPLERCYILAA